MDDPHRLSALIVVPARLELVWLLLLNVGGYAAVLGWRPGAWLMLGSVCAMIAGHQVMGVTAYRSAMRRPWPDVAPLEDDDW